MTAPRHIAEGLFPESDVHYVAHYGAIADVFDEIGDQRPSTCAAYAARYLLAALGFPEAEGIDTTREDYLAWLAGTVLEPAEVGPADAAAATARAEGLSDAEALRRFPDTFYAWPLRSSGDPTVVGTSPAGLARAVSVGSDGALVTLPVPARRADGEVLFNEARFRALVQLLEENLAAWSAHPVANYESDHLLDPTSEAYRLGLTAPDPVAAAPLDTWGVGHFAGIGALWRAVDGVPWVLLLDTYKGRGWSGYEPQPAELLRRGMVRTDGREGGLLLILPRHVLNHALGAVERLGLEVRMWGNGSLEPEGWTWALGR